MTNLTYDAQKHAELLAARESNFKALDEIADKMHDEYNSDAWGGEDGAAKMSRYMADQQRHAQLTREIEVVDRQIDRMESCKPADPQKVKGTYRDILRRWFQKGGDGLEHDEREMFIGEPSSEMANFTGASGGEVFNPMKLFEGKPEYSWLFDPHMSAQRKLAIMATPSRGDINAPSASGADDALGLARPETWDPSVVESLLYYGAVAANCHNFTTSNGNDIHQNQLDTTAEEGGSIYNQSQTADQGVPDPEAKGVGDITDLVWKSLWRHSNFIGARLETFDDIHFDVAGRITREMGRRLGRGWNRWFTNGTGIGNNQPQGIVPSAQIVNGGAGSADDGSGGIDYKNLLDLEYSIDLGYLQGNEGGDGGFMDNHGGMIGFMMNRNVEKQLRNAFVGGTAGNLPVWVPDRNRGIGMQRAPATILGYPYTINQHMQDGTANNHLPLLFGACGHFGVRNVGGPMYYRFWDSATVRRMSIEWIAFSRRFSMCRGPVYPSTYSVAANRGKCPAYSVLQVKS